MLAKYSTRPGGESYEGMREVYCCRVSTYCPEEIVGRMASTHTRATSAMPIGCFQRKILRRKFSAASMKNMAWCFHLATYKIKVNLDNWIESNIAIMALRGSKPGHHVETGGTFVSTNVTCRFYLRLQWGWQFSSPARQTHSEFQSLYSYSAALFCILSASIYYSSPISHKFQLKGQ